MLTMGKAMAGIYQGWHIPRLRPAFESEQSEMESLVCVCVCLCLCVLGGRGGGACVVYTGVVYTDHLIVTVPKMKKTV